MHKMIGPTHEGPGAIFFIQQPKKCFYHHASVSWVKEINADYRSYIAF